MAFQLEFELVFYDSLYFLRRTLSTLKSYLVEISKLSNLVPEVAHDLLVAGVSVLLELAAALDECVPQSQALEVVLVEVAIVVDVCKDKKKGKKS